MFENADCNEVPTCTVSSSSPSSHIPMNRKHLIDRCTCVKDVLGKFIRADHFQKYPGN